MLNVKIYNKKHINSVKDYDTEKFVEATVPLFEDMEDIEKELNIGPNDSYSLQFPYIPEKYSLLEDILTGNDDIFYLSAVVAYFTPLSEDKKIMFAKFMEEENGDFDTVTGYIDDYVIIKDSYKFGYKEYEASIMTGEIPMFNDINIAQFGLDLLEEKEAIKFFHGPANAYHWIIRKEYL